MEKYRGRTKIVAGVIGTFAAAGAIAGPTELLDTILTTDKAIADINQKRTLPLCEPPGENDPQMPNSEPNQKGILLLRASKQEAVSTPPCITQNELTDLYSQEIAVYDRAVSRYTRSTIVCVASALALAGLRVLKHVQNRTRRNNRT